MIPDYDNHEMIIRILDSPDVIEAMAVIKQTMVSTMVDILKSLKNNAYPKVSNKCTVQCTLVQIETVSFRKQKNTNLSKFVQIGKN